MSCLLVPEFKLFERLAHICEYFHHLNGYCRLCLFLLPIEWLCVDVNTICSVPVANLLILRGLDAPRFCLVGSAEVGGIRIEFDGYHSPLRSSILTGG